MWRKYYFRILLKLVITASTVISITYFCLRSQHAIILYPSQVIRKDTVGKYSQASNTGIEFVTEKGCWNFSLNPLIRFKLEADVSPDLNYFIRHNQEFLKARIISKYQSMSKRSIMDRCRLLVLELKLLATRN